MSAIHQSGPTSRIILGIDPGVAIVGYAVVEVRGDALRMIADVIRFLTTPPSIEIHPPENRFLGDCFTENERRYPWRC